MVLPTRPNINEQIPNGPFGRLPDVTIPEASDSSAEPEKTDGDKTKRVRARNEDGHFIKDDPSTPEDEAWVEVSAAD